MKNPEIAIFVVILGIFVAFALHISPKTGFAVMGEGGYPIYSTFDGNTTDFLNVENLSCVDHPRLEKAGNGSIVFMDSCVNVTDADFDSYVKINSTFIGIDVDHLANMDKTVLITFNNTGYDNPYVLKDGEICAQIYCMPWSVEGDSFSFITTSNEISGKISNYTLGGYNCNNNSICEQDEGEVYTWCSDCRCNHNGQCEDFFIFRENRTNCASDCGTCNNDSTCQAEYENRSSCPFDCSVCDFNGICNSIYGENRSNCNDCSICNNNSICEQDKGESQFNCPTDCPPDTTPPEITSVNITDIQYDSAKVRIHTDEDCSCAIRYGTSHEIYPFTETVSTVTGVEAIKTIESLESNKTYYYKIICNDSVNNSAETEEDTFTTEEEPPFMKYPEYDKFDGDTTDFLSRMDIEHVYEAVLEISKYGKIEFLEDPINFSYANLDQYVRIEDNLISIDTTMLPNLNKVSKVYFYNVSLDDPGILRNSEPCPIDECDEPKYSNGVFSFIANEWGYFQLKENKDFKIWDSTDTENTGLNQTVSFYADLRHLGRIVVYDNVTCKIDFPDFDNTTERDMKFNFAHNYYVYTGIFGSPGTFTYEITCDAADIGLGIVKNSSTFYINDTSVCGDGICYSSANENCSTCPSDCGVCPPKNCTAEWTCGNWSDCRYGLQTRNCVITEDCLYTAPKPIMKQNCTEEDLCSNGVKDDLEEGIDCGGPCPECETDNATCYDNIKNQDEEGIDCGGMTCPPCQEKETCDDGILNQNEIDVDCGGVCPPCIKEESCFDGILNQDEDDVDCGGVCKPCISPQIEEPTGTFPRTIVIIAIAVLVLGGGGAGLYFFKPEILSQAVSMLKPKPKSQGDAIENYVRQNIQSGYNPDMVEAALVRGGWDKAKVESAINKAINKVYARKLAQIEPLIRRMDLRRPDMIYSILIRRGYPSFLVKAAIKKVLDEARSGWRPGQNNYAQ